MVQVGGGVTAVQRDDRAMLYSVLREIHQAVGASMKQLSEPELAALAARLSAEATQMVELRDREILTNLALKAKALHDGFATLDTDRRLRQEADGQRTAVLTAEELSGAWRTQFNGLVEAFERPSPVSPAVMTALLSVGLGFIEAGSKTKNAMIGILGLLLGLDILGIVLLVQTDPVEKINAEVNQQIADEAAQIRELLNKLEQQQRALDQSIKIVKNSLSDGLLERLIKLAEKPRGDARWLDSLTSEQICALLKALPAVIEKYQQLASRRVYIQGRAAWVIKQVLESLQKKLQQLLWDLYRMKPEECEQERQVMNVTQFAPQSSPMVAVAAEAAYADSRWVMQIFSEVEQAGRR